MSFAPSPYIVTINKWVGFQPSRIRVVYDIAIPTSYAALLCEDRIFLICFDRPKPYLRRISKGVWRSILALYTSHWVHAAFMGDDNEKRWRRRQKWNRKEKKKGKMTRKMRFSSPEDFVDWSLCRLRIFKYQNTTEKLIPKARFRETTDELAPLVDAIIWVT